MQMIHRLSESHLTTLSWDLGNCPRWNTVILCELFLAKADWPGSSALGTAVSCFNGPWSFCLLFSRCLHNKHFLSVYSSLFCARVKISSDKAVQYAALCPLLWVSVSQQCSCLFSRALRRIGKLENWHVELHIYALDFIICVHIGIIVGSWKYTPRAKSSLKTA